ncbi:MAG: amidohydrolase family protein [Actinomycetota bacterium]
MKWILDGSVYDMEAGTFRRADVAIQGERIAEAPPAGKPAGGDEVIHAAGLYLLPGLIDCHVHLVARSEEADPSLNASRNDGEIARYAEGAAERTLFAGVTTVRDVGGWNYIEMDLRTRIEGGHRSGPRMFLAGRLLSVPTPADRYYPGMYEVVRGSNDVRAAVKQQIDRGADLIKVMATGAMLSPEDEDAGEAQFTPDELRVLVETAEGKGVHVAAHAHAREGIENAVRAGVSSIEHGTFADEPVLREMADRGTFLVPTLCASPSAERDAALLEAMPAHIRDRLERTQGVHIQMVRDAHRLGVPVAMGTDAGTPGNHHGGNADECVRMVEEAGMSPAASIRAATLNAAMLLRQDGNLGTLEPGKYADVIGCRGNPLEDVRELTRVAFVMKGGAILKNDLGSA